MRDSSRNRQVAPRRTLHGSSHSLLPSSSALHPCFPWPSSAPPSQAPSSTSGAGRTQIPCSASSVCSCSRRRTFLGCCWHFPSSCMALCLKMRCAALSLAIVGAPQSMLFSQPPLTVAVWYYFNDIYPPLHNNHSPLDPPAWWIRLIEGRPAPVEEQTEDEVPIDADRNDPVEAAAAQ